MNERKIELLNTQLTATYTFIAISLILTTITYNTKLGLENKKQIYTKTESKNIELACRLIILIIFFIYLYINIENKKLNKEKEGFNLQITASILTIIAATIILYVVISQSNESIVENPEA